MSGSRFALTLLTYGDAVGLRDELIGDLVEELARGRSAWWVCRQLIGGCGLVVIGRMRERTRLTPHGVALGLGLLLLAASSVASLSSVLAAWLGIYYVAGTLSLFAEMALRTIGVTSQSASGVGEPPAAGQ